MRALNMSAKSGARVGPASAPEIGWLDVALTAAGRIDPVLGVLPPRATVFQWHHYTFEIPDGGTELARSEICTQAFRLAQPAWGIQFHAEVTLPMVTAWADEDSDDLPVPVDLLIAASRTEIARSNDQGRALCAAFLREAARG